MSNLGVIPDIARAGCRVAAIVTGPCPPAQYLDRIPTDDIRSAIHLARERGHYARSVCLMTYLDAREARQGKPS